MSKALNLLFALFLLTLVGCASVDPLEPVNRKIFVFNMFIDKGVLRPIATAYDKIVPSVVACRIENFFSNLDDVTNVANNVLQCKFLDAWSDCWRLAFNTTFGLFGLFDVATCAGLPKHHQDFGLTLARYGFVNSTYLMIPFFGPSTTRDTIGWSVDWRFLSVWPYLQPPVRYGLYGLSLVHKRAGLLPADKLIDDAMDPYLFVRDAYLQKRECDIKSICPPCEEAAPRAADKDKPEKDDPFVAENEDGKSATTDPNDTFVPEAKGSDKSGEKPVASKAAASDDPFIAP